MQYIDLPKKKLLRGHHRRDYLIAGLRYIYPMTTRVESLPLPWRRMIAFVSDL